MYMYTAACLIELSKIYKMCILTEQYSLKWVRVKNIIPPSTVGRLLTSCQPLFNLLMAYRLATVQCQSVEFSFTLKRTCMCSKTQPEVKLYDYDQYS